VYSETGRHNDGSIWLYTGTPCSGTSCPGWQMLDNNSGAVAISSSGTHIYQQHNDGSIWHYTGPPCSGTSCPAARLAASGQQPERESHSRRRIQLTPPPIGCKSACAKLEFP
jgi:hypothetical protein